MLPVPANRVWAAKAFCSRWGCYKKCEPFTAFADNSARCTCLGQIDHRISHTSQVHAVEKKLSLHQSDTRRKLKRRVTPAHGSLRFGQPQITTGQYDEDLRNNDSSRLNVSSDSLRRLPRSLSQLSGPTSTAGSQSRKPARKTQLRLKCLDHISYGFQKLQM